MEAILTVTRCVFLVCAWICISLWVMGTLLKNIASPQGDLTSDLSDVSIHERNSKPPYPGDTDKHLHIFVQVFNPYNAEIFVYEPWRSKCFLSRSHLSFPKQISETHGGISFILHTHIPEGCRCAFGGL